ncbi:MAG: hypothetical protein IJV59_05195 [Eubacterium sp.]|nr:hypothetical protein [Eubacterium sp.]MBQ9023407.1 hypothetical protein [Eubacterium sp.]
MKIDRERVARIQNLWTAFLDSCDEQELDSWDKDELGEMDAYYANEALSVAIHLIAADGIFGDDEVECLNGIFDYDYSVETLEETYENVDVYIDAMFDDELDDGILLLRGYNDDMADAYQDLLCEICDAIIESDGDVSRKEREEAQELKIRIGKE